MVTEVIKASETEHSQLSKKLSYNNGRRRWIKSIMSESLLSTVSDMKCAKCIPEFGFPDFRGLVHIKRICRKIMLLAQSFSVPHKIQWLH